MTRKPPRPPDPENRPVDPIRARSRKQVMNALRRVGAAARIELAEEAGLSPATMTVVTGELLAESLIREVAEKGATGSSRRGRPRTLLEINPDAAYAVGIKISMHQASVSLTNMVGDVLGSETVPIRANRVSPETIAEICNDRAVQIIAEAGIDPDLVLGVGVGVPGFVRYPTGVVRWGPIFNDRDVPLRDIVEQRTGLRTFVDNDANMAALAEKWFGIGRHHDTFVVVSVEHGVGMGLVIDGALYRGVRGFGAEFGHTKVVVGGALCRCGQRGCVEAYVSDYAIIREASVFHNPPNVDDPQAVHDAIRHLIDAADAGDEPLRTVFRRAGTMLGIGISNLFNVLDPSVVVLTGERTHSAQVFFEAMHGSLQGNPLLGYAEDLKVEINPWGDDLWARGAAALVLEEVQI